MRRSSEAVVEIQQPRDGGGTARNHVRSRGALSGRERVSARSRPVWFRSGSEARPVFVLEAERRRLLAHGFVDLLIERRVGTAGSIDLLLYICVALRGEVRDLPLELLALLRRLGEQLALLGDRQRGDAGGQLRGGNGGDVDAAARDVVYELAVAQEVAHAGGRRYVECAAPGACGHRRFLVEPRRRFDFGLH